MMVTSPCGRVPERKFRKFPTGDIFATKLAIINQSRRLKDTNLGNVRHSLYSEISLIIPSESTSAFTEISFNNPNTASRSSSLCA